MEKTFIKICQKSFKLFFEETGENVTEIIERNYTYNFRLQT